ncbi:MAG TPA: hypothetical protein VL099_15510 [Candidatus Binatia bacterium]|nr:hypothetical protein [Candidatus Binatia bacterium]
MAFRFSLRGLLRLRTGQERMERLRLTALAAEILQTRLAAASVVQESLEARRNIQKQMSAGLWSAELYWEGAREERRVARRNSLMQSLAELTARYSRQAAVYQKVRRQLRVLENLQARRYQQYLVEQGRREQRVLDEAFLLHSFHHPEG